MSIFKIKEVKLDRDGELTKGLGYVTEEANQIKLEVINSPDPETILANHVALDEDDLFDYEKIVIPFQHSGIHRAIIVEDGKIQVENRTGQSSMRSFQRFFSGAEFEIAVESQVYSVDSNDAENINWVQTQHPGLYKTPTGIITVFRDKNGKMNYVTEGSSTVWFSPATPTDEPTINEELSNLQPETPPARPTRASQDTLESLRNSEEFRRMRETLHRGQPADPNPFA